MTVPVAPALRGKTISAGKIGLSWRDVPEAATYDLYRGADREDVLLIGNERQKVAVRATGGTFKLSFGAAQTSDLDFNLSAADLKAALDQLFTISPGGSVSVTRAAATGGFDYVVTFEGTLERTNVSAMVSDSTSLTGGTHTATVSTLTTGGPYDDNVTSPYVDSVAAGTRKVYLLRAVNGSGTSPDSNVISLQNATVVDHSGDSRVPTGVRSSLGTAG